MQARFQSIRLAALLVGASVAAGVNASCAQVLGIDDTQLASEEQPTGLTLPAACTGNEKLASGETVPISLTCVEFTSGNPAAGISVRAFRSPTDFSTFKTTVACGLSDANGSVTVEVPKGTSGYNGFLLVSGVKQETFFYFFSPPPTQKEEFTFLSLSNDDWSALRGALQLADLPKTHGQVTINALDNAGQAPLAGVRFELAREDDQTKSFYFTDTGQPNLAGTETSKPGFGGFFNVPAGGGTNQVKMIRTTDGAELGSIDVYVYPGAWTTMRIKSNQPSM